MLSIIAVQVPPHQTDVNPVQCFSLFTFNPHTLHSLLVQLFSSGNRTLWDILETASTDDLPLILGQVRNTQKYAHLIKLFFLHFFYKVSCDRLFEICYCILNHSRTINFVSYQITVLHFFPPPKIGQLLNILRPLLTGLPHSPAAGLSLEGFAHFPPVLEQLMSGNADQDTWNK